MNILNSTILTTFSIIFSILVFAFLVIKYLQKKNNKPYTELYDRTKSWFYMILIFAISVFLNDILAMIFFALLSYLALKEYFTLIPTRLTDRRIMFYGYLVIIFQYYLAYIQWYEVFIICIPVYLFLFLPFRQMLIGDTKGFINNTSKVQWGVMLFVFAISHVAYLLRLPSIDLVSGAMMVLYLIFLTELNDILQYVCGKSFGKRKIIPKVSPNKTVEGFVGAMILTTTLAVVFSYLTPFTILEAIGAGLIINIGGFIGDVVVSMVKRDVGVKDGGNMIAGHGGIIDRIDSLTYTAPLFFHYVYYLYY
ncbi:phosphatidate cytidylyltransferase [Arcobacter sp. LA11]|uniref:phosphatidate cytidylyltransferase n=1 Tax=Arcobacter sp. LA11 TaxID=1898176 RepID=UPI000932ABB0|nr:phosphatidate cytidylyltransferase [Arcobacter sp. LA11]